MQFALTGDAHRLRVLFAGKRLRPVALIIVMVLAGAFFCAIAHEVMVAHGMALFDQSGIAWSQSFQSAAMSHFMRRINAMHDPVVLTGLLVFWAAFIFRREWDQAWLLAWIVPGGMLMNVLAKHFFQRPRPLLETLANSHGYSFPSGHSIEITLIAGFLFYTACRLSDSVVIRGVATIFCAMLIALVGFSRLYLGMHYPTDVVAGFFGGVCWVCFCLVVYETYKKDRL